MALTYRELVRQTRALGRDVRRGAEQQKKRAAAIADEAKDTGRIADQIAALHVDAATIAETRETSKIMQGLSEAALAQATAAEEAARSAQAAEQQAVATHGGIQEARDNARVPMAARQWYTQE
ncbi:hypothetical protein [Kitasatospora sp. NPDC090091]|uniref:hypothetical protein n=1 Tax=Kitasatospora sp. NPDC090091 TaxID=3364081 RepID=UPI003823B359